MEKKRLILADCMYPMLNCSGNTELLYECIDIFNLLAAVGEAVIFKSQLSNKLYAVGYNSRGQLGNNSTINQCIPVAVCGNHNFNKISGGNGFALAVDENGKSWAWGYNREVGGAFGCLGDNSGTNKSTPVAICGNHTFCHISAGFSVQSGAIDNNGKAWAWGSNNNGSLGIGNSDFGFTTCTPTAIYGNHTFCNIAMGSHSLAIDNHNKLWVWGDVIIPNKSTPTEVIGVQTFCKIAVGVFGTVALDNNAKGWYVSNTSPFSPVAMPYNHSYCDISVGRYWLAIATDNETYSWGENNKGQLGDNTIISKTSPIKVCGEHLFRCVVTDDLYNGYALDDQGQVWGWGYNRDGQLGIGNTTDKSTPVAVCH